MSAKPFTVLVVAMLTFAVAPARAQEVFAAGDSCKATMLGDDPAICGDADRIAQTESLTKSTARVFDLWSSQSAQGDLGRYLEGNGYTAQSGVCQNKPNRIVLFLRNDKLCEANKVSEVFAAGPTSDNRSPNDGGPGEVFAAGPPPGPTKIPGPSGGANTGKVTGSNPCQPFGKGGYDYCQNPRGTRLPAGCDCGGGGGPNQTPVLRQPIDLAAQDMPCSTPALDQLALPPDDGDVAVAYALPPEGGDVAQAYSLPPDDGDIAVALALPQTTTTLTGGVTETGTFVPQPTPLVLRGKASINGWPVAPQSGTRLRGYATKSLRVPVTYKTTKPPAPRSTANDAKIRPLLTGGAHHYSEDEGRYRCLSGFLQGMAAEMGQQARSGAAEKAKKQNETARKREKLLGKTCEIRADPPQAFEDAIVKPDKELAAAGKFVTDMIDKVLEHNEDLQKKFPKLKTSLMFLGPLLEGAGVVKSFKETWEIMAMRDQRIKQMMRASPDGYIDPVQFCWFIGQDAADTYALTVRSFFSLRIE